MGPILRSRLQKIERRRPQPGRCFVCGAAGGVYPMPLPIVGVREAAQAYLMARQLGVDPITGQAWGAPCPGCGATEPPPPPELAREIERVQAEMAINDELRQATTRRR